MLPTAHAYCWCVQCQNNNNHVCVKYAWAGVAWCWTKDVLWGWLYTTSRPIVFREMWFVDCSWILQMQCIASNNNPLWEINWNPFLEQYASTLSCSCLISLCVQLVKDVRRLVDSGEFLANRHCSSSVCKLVVTLLLELITDHSREVCKQTNKQITNKQTNKQATNKNSKQQQVPYSQYLMLSFLINNKKKSSFSPMRHILIPYSSKREKKKYIKNLGWSGNRTRDLSHPKRESCL